MKTIIFIFISLTFIGCRNSEANAKASESDRFELLPESDKDLQEENKKKLKAKKYSSKTNYVAADFLKLKNNTLQIIFFNKLDSIRKVQYPKNNHEVSIMVDLTPKYLNDFLTSINLDSLSQNNMFGKDYHFNVAPKGYSDPKVCDDRIEVYFDKSNCQFTMKIYNTFLVENDWCTESMVIYGFTISGKSIVSFSRNEAG
jgi:hypothetical protein